MTSATSVTSASSQVEASPIAVGELRGVAGAVAGDALLVDHDRDAEARALDRDALDLVHQAGAGRRAEAGRRADPGDVADAVLELARPPRRRRSDRPAPGSVSQMLPIWASFSSRVMRPSRSSTRSSIGASGSRKTSAVMSCHLREGGLVGGADRRAVDGWIGLDGRPAAPGPTRRRRRRRSVRSSTAAACTAAPRATSSSASGTTTGRPVRSATTWR